VVGNEKNAGEDGKKDPKSRYKNKWLRKSQATKAREGKQESDGWEMIAECSVHAVFK